MLALLAVASGLALAGGLVAVAVLRREGLGRFIPEVARPWAGEAAAVLRAYGRDRGLQVEITALGLLYQALIITAFWLLAVGLDLGLDPAELTLVVPPVVLISALPISIAGFGVREGAFVVLLGRVRGLGRGRDPALPALGRRRRDRLLARGRRDRARAGLPGSACAGAAGRRGASTLSRSMGRSDQIVAGSDREGS